jgi:signal transduction histidine kinase
LPALDRQPRDFIRNTPAPGGGPATAPALPAELLEREAQRLQRALNKQRGLNRLQREFILMAAHEFGTPLAIIDGQAQGIARRADRVTPDDLRRRVAKIRTAVERMNEMVQRSLALFSATLTEGDPLAGAPSSEDEIELASEGKRVEIDLARLISAACEAYQDLSRSHQIVVDLAGLTSSVWGNYESLRQILANLLANAIKYSPGGGRIHVTARTEKEFAVIVVRDEGLGIPEQDVDKVFQRFFRATNTTGIAGTGLGLNLVQDVVKHNPFSYNRHDTKLQHRLHLESIML